MPLDMFLFCIKQEVIVRSTDPDAFGDIVAFARFSGFELDFSGGDRPEKLCSIFDHPAIPGYERFFLCG